MPGEGVRIPVELNDRRVFREAMNGALAIDPARAVVLTVDMQRDYLDPQVASRPVAAREVERVVAHTVELLDLARREGIPVVHAYVQRRSVEVERGFDGGALKRTSESLRVSQNLQAGVPGIPDRVEGSPTAEVLPSLVAPGDVHVPTKKTLDSFYATDLDVLLREVYRAQTVVIAGVNTDTCVYCTTFSASNRGYAPVVVSSCTASMRGEDQHWMALELMSRSIAWVLTLDELRRKLDRPRAAKV